MAYQSSLPTTSCRTLLKRKRSFDEQNEDKVENERPAKQPHIFAEEGSLGAISSSSECFTVTSSVTFDCSLDSPQSVEPQSEHSKENDALEAGTNLNGEKKAMMYSKSDSFATPLKTRQTPLPFLSWADSNEVWESMCLQDEQIHSERDPEMFHNHPGLQPRMRAILLDWLIEVCEVYKLHRETYYLAVDYLDRYLSGPQTITKSQLQLLGITCLFIAAKVEEIYPPKIHEFAYVTDTACLEDEILNQELFVLKALNWNITPITVIGWLSVYMQLHTKSRHLASNMDRQQSRPLEVRDSFVLPQYSGAEFSQTCRLLDLCSMEPGMALFSYSIIAAAAMAHTFGKKTAMAVSGLSWAALEPCFKWMEPFFFVIAEEKSLPGLPTADEQVSHNSGLRHICPHIVMDESHTLQTHGTSLEMFDNALLRQQQVFSSTLVERSPSSLLVPKCPPGLLTPPSSSRKGIETAGAT